MQVPNSILIAEGGKGDKGRIYSVENEKGWRKFEAEKPEQ